MAERKVQSKHIPADYDHRVLKHLNRNDAKHQQQKRGGGGAASASAASAAAGKDTVRLMLPFNVCCGKCSQYMYRGRKFNAKKQVSQDNAYLGTKQLLFHIKCEHCSNPIVFRTDPESSGFAMVSGARENKTSEGLFNPLAGVVEKDDDDDDNKKKEHLDAMAALEARALETRLEMEKITELTREMQRSAQREQSLRRGGGGGAAPINEELPTTEEEEQALERYRQDKRARLFASEDDSAVAVVTPPPPVGAAAALEKQQEEDDDATQFVVERSKRRAAPVSAPAPPPAASSSTFSLVGYADDSDDDDE